MSSALLPIKIITFSQFLPYLQLATFSMLCSFSIDFLLSYSNISGQNFSLTFVLNFEAFCEILLYWNFEKPQTIDYSWTTIRSIAAHAVATWVGNNPPYQLTPLHYSCLGDRSFPHLTAVLLNSCAPMSINFNLLALSALPQQQQKMPCRVLSLRNLFIFHLCRGRTSKVK